MEKSQSLSHVQEIQKVIYEKSLIPRDIAILESWKRCVQLHSLDPLISKDAYILPEAKLKQHQEQLEDLMRTARFGLETLYQEIVGQNYVVLLTDAEGVTVDYIGDPYKDDELKQAGLYLGSEWSEHRAGTCGIGSCIYTGEPITVHQTDHFDASHISLTCTAAPIYNPLGELSAVLDVSALHSPEIKQSQAFAQHLVRLWAIRIEMAVLVNNFQSEWIITFSKSSVFFAVAPEYAVALDENGRITGATRNATMLFNSTGSFLLNQQIIGTSVTDYLEIDLEDVPKLSRTASVNERIVRMHNGETLFVTVISTKKKINNIISNPSSRAYGILHGGDPQVERIAQKIEKIAQIEVNILLHGETGTGKEFLSKYIHKLRRSNKPFIAINCASIPENLIESELFGYTSGTFTGARREGKIGLIEQANGGTLFLDEIGDMPFNLQARLLRVLSEKEVVRIGSSATKSIDVRVISASHRDLRKLVADGKFREDLYYRIAGITFCLPPLRERKDLEWLIGKFLGNEKENSSILLEPKAKQALLEYKWPGNIRQMVNTLSLTKALSEGSISFHDLPEEVQLNSTYNSSDESLEDLLEGLNWNITAVANYLGCERSTIYRRMKKAKIVIERPDKGLE